ncbi:MAG: hypothetical protein EAX95_03890 [Candidatus Thorarchaeota archaeon]|nr:hypothetical protein [Candidatus Thorarchaeota archaeon]
MQFGAAGHGFASKKATSKLKNAGRYLLHGFILTAIVCGGSVSAIFVYQILIFGFGPIGMGLFFALFIPLLGAVNNTLMRHLWYLQLELTSAEQVVEGFVLYVVLIMLAAPADAVFVMLDSLVRIYGASFDLNVALGVFLILIMVYSGIYGIAGEGIGSRFEGNSGETVKLGNLLHVRCPHCGAAYSYREDQVGAEGEVTCQNCMHRFKAAES